MPFISKKDLNTIGAIAASFGVLDFFMEGKLGAPIARAIKKGGAAIATRALMTAPAAARVSAATLPRLAGTGLAIGRTIAMRHPVLTAGAVIYYTVKNRDEIIDLAKQGYEVLEDINAPMAERRREFGSDPRGFMEDIFEDRPLIRPLGAPIPGLKPKRRTSTYNTAVSKGMKAIKKSTSYGKKGVLNAPKKAFAFVAKTVSKLRKGKKVSSKGASGVVKRALPGIKKIKVRK